MTKEPRVELDVIIARMQRVLDTGHWPSGSEVTPADRRSLEWNLELARRERRRIHAETARAYG